MYVTAVVPWHPTCSVEDMRANMVDTLIMQARLLPGHTRLAGRRSAGELVVSQCSTAQRSAVQCSACR
eukprot:1942866-Pyramimonas_sp.AAC.1